MQEPTISSKKIIVKATVGRDIVVDTRRLPQEVIMRVVSEFRILNPERVQAKKLGVYFAHIPEYIQLYELPLRDELIVPRGMGARLAAIGEEYGVEFDVNDDTVTYLVAREERVPLMDLRPHQEIAVNRICEEQQGIYVAPPGAGKTIVALEAIRRTNLRALVIVNTTNIAAQWVDRCESYLGFRPGIVGDSQWDSSQDITIALAQTLNSRAEPLKRNGWFRRFGFVCLDEMHHVSAPTVFDSVNSFPAVYRLGISATPDRETGLFKLALATFGSVIHTTNRAELIDAGFLVVPKIIRVNTEFEYPYVKTRAGNNYQQVVSELAKDKKRNDLIVGKIIGNPASANLVLSKRIGHLKEMHRLVLESGLFEPERVLMLTGREDTEERMRVATLAAEARCVVFSTIADEAMDVPRFDRLYLTWPTKSLPVVRQQVGRISRTHPKKKNAIVYDFVDRGNVVLMEQARSRRLFYMQDQYEVSEDR